MTALSVTRWIAKFPHLAARPAMDPAFPRQYVGAMPIMRLGDMEPPIGYATWLLAVKPAMGVDTAPRTA